MKAFKVIFQHGHFIDLETKQRIIPVQGQEYIINANPEAFTREDPKLTIDESKNSEQKALWAKKKFMNYHKLFKAGEQFIFRVGNSRTVKGDESYQYIFLCTLLEDLYLYLMAGKKSEETEGWRLAKCNCGLEKCLLGGLILSEKLQAESLNKLFTQTVMFYFSNQRSGSANALDTFFKYEPTKVVTFEDVLNKKYESLGDFRNAFVEGRK